jgi:HPt (histidine-containing phosphotransfer) domain-containing protein
MRNKAIPVEARAPVARSERDEPINPTVLKTLRALQREGRPDILTTLVTLFLDNARVLLKDLQRAAKDGDTELLGQVSHALGSASANIGASPLSARCRELERMARAGSVLKPEVAVAAIEAEFRHAEAALAAHLAEAAKGTMGISA